MKIRRTLLALGAVAGLALVATGCDADYYGGYSAADGVFWRNKGICNTMVPYGAIVGDLACYYPITPPPNAAIQQCARLAVGAFPSRGYDSIPAINFLLNLCGSGGGPGGYFD